MRGRLLHPAVGVFGREEQRAEGTEPAARVGTVLGGTGRTEQRRALEQEGAVVVVDKRLIGGALIGGDAHARTELPCVASENGLRPTVARIRVWEWRSTAGLAEPPSGSPQTRSTSSP